MIINSYFYVCITCSRLLSGTCVKELGLQLYTIVTAFHAALSSYDKPGVSNFCRESSGSVQFLVENLWLDSHLDRAF